MYIHFRDDTFPVNKLYTLHVFTYLDYSTIDISESSRGKPNCFIKLMRALFQKRILSQYYLPSILFSAAKEWMTPQVASLSEHVAWLCFDAAFIWRQMPPPSTLFSAVPPHSVHFDSNILFKWASKVSLTVDTLRFIAKVCLTLRATVTGNIHPPPSDPSRVACGSSQVEI